MRLKFIRFTESYIKSAIMFLFSFLRLNQFLRHFVLNKEASGHDEERFFTKITMTKF